MKDGRHLLPSVETKNNITLKNYFYSLYFVSPNRGSKLVKVECKNFHQISIVKSIVKFVFKNLKNLKQLKSKLSYLSIK